MSDVAVHVLAAFATPIILGVILGFTCIAKWKRDARKYEPQPADGIRDHYLRQSRSAERVRDLTRIVPRFQEADDGA